MARVRRDTTRPDRVTPSACRAPPGSTRVPLPLSCACRVKWAPIVRSTLRPTARCASLASISPAPHRLRVRLAQRAATDWPVARFGLITIYSSLRGDCVDHHRQRGGFVVLFLSFVHSLCMMSFSSSASLFFHVCTSLLFALHDIIMGSLCRSLSSLSLSSLSRSLSLSHLPYEPQGFCELCAVGTYASNASTIACTSCPAGTFGTFFVLVLLNHFHSLSLTSYYYVIIFITFIIYR